MTDTSGNNELGPTPFSHVATLVDQQLCDISHSFDYVLQITPTNASKAWIKFVKGNYSVEPEFVYRPTSCNLAELKTRLFETPIDQIKDATFAHLCLEKQDELGRQIASLKHIGTPAFLEESLQIFGDIESGLSQLAELLLKTVTFEWAQSFEAEQELVSGKDLAAQVEKEIALYQSYYSKFDATVELTNEIASGILVTKNKVLVSSTNNFRKSRVYALINHEIGTHLVTYINGQAQPFRQMYEGLAGYDCLQEGIAVLCEYLCGGLSLQRMRTLAARVVACEMMVKGNSFVETFDRLYSDLNFGAKLAFYITLRVFRGGGSTKDAIYLRGLQGVLDYLGLNSDLETLFVGKFAFHHIPKIEGLLEQGVLKPPAVLPHFLAEPEVQRRLNDCRGQSVMNLIGEQ